MQNTHQKFTQFETSLNYISAFPSPQSEASRCRDAKLSTAVTVHYVT